MARVLFDAKSEREQAQKANRDRLRAESKARIAQKRAEMERLSIAFKYCDGGDPESEKILDDLIAAQDSYKREVMRVGEREA
jgi:hypothetical protein